MTIQEIPTRCPRCDSRLLRYYDELTCSRFCGFTLELLPERPFVEPYVEELTVKPLRRIHGISAKESRRIYRNTPAGKAAWDRYRRSELFYEAHARHRQTQKYKDTQARYHEKQKLFMRILRRLNGDKEPESTCPLNLFYTGPNDEVYHNPSKCDAKDNDCTLTCLDINETKEVTHENHN